MRIVLKSESLRLLELAGPVEVCNGIALPFTFTETVLKRRLGNYHATLGRMPKDRRSHVACANLRKSLNRVKENIKQSEKL
jgi:hypothetical protein